jgi:spore coat polysaccharide biosynthesis protein SpsF
MSRAVAVVQARMSSSRLPGKTLADVEGEPLLRLLLRRLARARELRRIVVATSDEPVDDPIVAVARAAGADVFRGSRDDVLGRFVGALGGWDGPVARITADCPLVDPAIVDAVVALWHDAPETVYASNVAPRVHPDGLDVEVVGAAALRAVAAETRDAAAREHVTPAVRADPARFPAAGLAGDGELAGLRWTVDLPDDLEFVRAVARLLGEARWTASCGEILRVVRADPRLSTQPGRAWQVGSVDPQ